MELGKRLAIMLVCLCIATTLYIALLPNITNAQSASPICTSILPLIEKNLTDNCSALDRDQVCYGNRNVTVEYSDPASPISTGRSFIAPGDVISLKIIRSLTTLPYNPQDGTWGLAVIKVQANLPDTVSGQAVTFILFGDTSLIDASATMPPVEADFNPAPSPATLSGLNAFYFSTGISSQPTCNDLPQNGLMIQSPKGYQVTFKANGADVTIGSTVVLRAVPKQIMTITVIEGHATVNAAGVEKTAVTGQEVAILLGGQNGLEPAGPPIVQQPTLSISQSLPSLCAIGRAIKLSMPCNTEAQPLQQNVVNPTNPPPPPHVDPPANTAVPQPTPINGDHDNQNHHNDNADHQDQGHDHHDNHDPGHHE